MTCTISTSKATEVAAKKFFEENEELITSPVWRMLSDCVEVKYCNRKPNGFDKFWHAREGTSPTFLFRHWDKIKESIDSAEVLSSR